MDKTKIKIALEVAQQERAEKLQDIAHLDKLIQSYQQKLSQTTLSKEQIDNDPTLFDTDYDINASWADKIADILNKEKRFLHARQLQKIILKNEPGLDLSTIKKRVSSGLARLSKEKSAVNYKLDSTNQNVFWGSPAWLDDNGNIKKEYMYDKEQAQENKIKKRIIE